MDPEDDTLEWGHFFDVSKPQFSNLSTSTYEPVISHTVVGKADAVMNVLDDFTAMMEHFRSIEMDPKYGISHHVQPEDMFIPDALLNAAHEVIQNDYSLVASGQIQSEVSRAMGAPMKLAMNATLSPFTGAVKVLILGSGYGNDILRLVKAVSSATDLNIVCVEPDQKRADKCRQENDRTVVINGKNVRVDVIDGTYQSAYSDFSSRAPYDIILATYSLQHIIGNSWDAPYEKFNGLLKPSGVALGCYFDHDSYFTLQAEIALDSNNQIFVGALRQANADDKADPMVGIRPTKVFGTVFDDPYVSQELIHGFAMFHRLQYQVYRGQGVLQSFAHLHSKSFEKASRISNRCSSLCTVVVLRNMIDVPIPGRCPIAAGIPKVAPGKHVSNADLQHFRCNTYAAAVKRDGEGVVGVFDGSGFSLYRKGVKFKNFVALSFSRPLFVQVEWIESTGEMYVLDALPESFSLVDMPFLFRYTYAQIAVRMNTAFVPKLMMNEHDVVRSVADIDIWRSRFFPPAGFAQKDKPPEGMVLVPLSGAVHGRFSTTRYVKFTVTGDVLIDGVVRECPRMIIGHSTRKLRSCADSAEKLDQYTLPVYDWDVLNPIRVRDDKAGKPNPPSVLEDLLKAPNIETCFQELARGCDWEFDWNCLPGLGKDYVYLPRNNSVPADTWLALYTMRSTVPLEHAPKVQSWLLGKLNELSDDYHSQTIEAYEEDYDYCGVHHLLSPGVEGSGDFVDALREEAAEEHLRQLEEEELTRQFGPSVYVH